MAVGRLKIYTESELVAMVTVKWLSDTVLQKYSLNLLNKINFLYVVKHSLKIGAWS
jgi:hypothetical protein